MTDTTELKPGYRIKHKKRGSEYEIVGTGRIQCDVPIEDMEEVAIYRGDDGKLWARAIDEMWDGRFQSVPRAILADREARTERPLPDEVGRVLKDMRDWTSDLTDDVGPPMTGNAEEALAVDLKRAADLITRLSSTEQAIREDERGKVIDALSDIRAEYAGKAGTAKKSHRADWLLCTEVMDRAITAIRALKGGA